MRRQTAEANKLLVVHRLIPFSEPDAPAARQILNVLPRDST
jgi:hypothetical protein